MNIASPAISFPERAGVAPSANPQDSIRRASLLVVLLAVVAFAIKIQIAFNTFGTNDVVAFYTFARSLSDHGLEWTYRNGVVWFSNFPVFNHPPLTAYYLEFIESLSRYEFCRDYGLTFPFLLRLPGIVADFIVVLLLLRMSALTIGTRIRVPVWALGTFALSPVSIMVSGFHGNTDPVMVMFLFAAAYMCLQERPALCGLFFALSCQIKIVPILFIPIFICFWFARGKAFRFLIPALICSLILWAEPLVRFPGLFFRNVLGYGSYWGTWGFTYWLRLTGGSQFSRVSFYNLSLAQNLTVLILKLIIIAAVIMIAWRRRHLGGPALIHSLAYAWMIFFVFAPGIGVQHMIWLAPFVLILSPSFYACLLAASSLFLFFFYNLTAGGLPWHLAVSTNALSSLTTPWSLWPWAVLIIGLIYFWRNAVAADASLRLFNFKTVFAENA
jgi:uncharacterized membrane protein